MSVRLRRIAIGASSALVLLVVAAALFAPARPSDLVCRAVGLQDTITGLLVAGVEDVALDPVAPRLILSAYDRHTDEPGGLYGVPLDDLLMPSGRLIAAPRFAPVPGGPPLRPHGFTIAPAAPDGKSARLAVIVRTLRSEGGHSAQLRFFSLSASGLAPAGIAITAPSLCNANDVAAIDAGSGWLVTSDRKACGSLGRFVEDVLGDRNSSVRAVRGRTLNTVASDIPFANGIAIDDNDVYVAATRAKSIYVYDRAALLTGNRAALIRTWPLGVAPDNLAVGSDGSIYIAAHENLLRYALFRAGLRKTSRSLIYRFDPASGLGPQRIGVVGGRGEPLQGVTVALRIGMHLVLGSAYDTGLALCTLPPGDGS